MLNSISSPHLLGVAASAALGSSSGGVSSLALSAALYSFGGKASPSPETASLAVLSASASALAFAFSTC